MIFLRRNYWNKSLLLHFCTRLLIFIGSVCYQNMLILGIHTSYQIFAFRSFVSVSCRQKISLHSQLQIRRKRMASASLKNKHGRRTERNKVIKCICFYMYGSQKKVVLCMLFRTIFLMGKMFVRAFNRFDNLYVSCLVQRIFNRL